VVCQSTIKNIKFLRNNAKELGGAIFYDLYKPTVDNIVFNLNFASQGDNYGSYPAMLVPKITLSQILLVKSG
jgi:predicted outer membrane repeat protein